MDMDEIEKYKTFINANGEIIAICLECSSQFVRDHGKQIFCSEKCSNRHRQRKYRDRHKKHVVDIL